MMRAEKTTPNANAFRTLLLGVLGAILILVGIDPALRLYDEHIRARPWLSAEVEIMPVVGNNRPNIRYAVAARGYILARWVAYIDRQAGDEFVRGCGGSGQGSYSPGSAGRLWGWEEWLGRDCRVPTVPYRLCVRYDAQTPRGAASAFGPYCSAVHRPGEAD